jgi:hypothetical protein
MNGESRAAKLNHNKRKVNEQSRRAKEEGRSDNARRSTLFAFPLPA